MALKTSQIKHLNHEDLKKYDGMLTYSRDKRRQVALAERFGELWAQQGEAAAERLCKICSAHPHEAQSMEP